VVVVFKVEVTSEATGMGGVGGRVKGIERVGVNSAEAGIYSRGSSGIY
jgi:hypothetical protein